MKAVCPRSPQHKRFITTAHVIQDWVVDEEGNFIEVLTTTEVTHPPHPHNYWECLECGREAEFKED